MMKTFCILCFSIIALILNEYLSFSPSTQSTIFSQAILWGQNTIMSITSVRQILQFQYSLSGLQSKNIILLNLNVLATNALVKIMLLGVLGEERISTHS